MADNARKAVVSALLDTWSRGPSLLPLLTDLGVVARGGDSVDVPYIGALTVNTSESGSVASTSLSTYTLTVNRPKFINQAVTMQAMAQLLNGNDTFTQQLVRASSGQLLAAIERDIVEYMITNSAVGYHVNLAADAITDEDVNTAEAVMREQDGVANTMGDLFWLASPRAASAIKTAADFSYDGVAPQGELGLPMIGKINGLPVYTHNALPGGVLGTRQSVATSAVSVASNVATATVPAGHGFVAGQQIWTADLTQNIAVSSPVTISSVTSTTIVYPLVRADGALADGVGTIYSASSMAMLVYKPWIYYATDGAQPFVELVKREANAGYSLQLYQHIGRMQATGACVIMHCPD